MLTGGGTSWRSARRESRETALSLLKAGRAAEATEHIHRCISVTADMCRQLMRASARALTATQTRAPADARACKALKAAKIEYVVAPYEGAFASRARKCAEPCRAEWFAWLRACSGRTACASLPDTERLAGNLGGL